MINRLKFGIAAAAILATGSVALAKQYVDYAPERGLWEINAVEVDPNHVDDYLTGLRKSQVPGFDIMKKHGIIDEYHFVVRNGYNKGAPNVLIETHFTSAAMLDPDQARDQMVEKGRSLRDSATPIAKVAVAGYEKYRQFIDDGLLWARSGSPNNRTGNGTGSRRDCRFPFQSEIPPSAETLARRCSAGNEMTPAPRRDRRITHQSHRAGRARGSDGRSRPVVLRLARGHRRHVESRETRAFRSWEAQFIAHHHPPVGPRISDACAGMNERISDAVVVQAQAGRWRSPRP